MQVAKQIKFDLALKTFSRKMKNYYTRIVPSQRWRLLPDCEGGGIGIGFRCWCHAVNGAMLLKVEQQTE